MISVLNLSYPRKKLISLFDEVILQAKLKGYDTKKMYTIIPLFLVLSLQSKTVSAKELKLNNTEAIDFLYSLILPLMEVLKSSKDITVSIKYALDKLKMNNQ